MTDRPRLPPSQELKEEHFYRTGDGFRWRRFPRFVICTAADRPPLFMWNRYPHNTIGAAIRLWGKRYISIVWKKS